MTTRVLIVDDNRVVRRILSKMLSADPGIQVVGTAPDAYDARTKVVVLKPDVITLDIDMPKMDGITFLRKLMVYRPTPVIVVSSFAEEGSVVSLSALEAGAFDVMCKSSAMSSMDGFSADLVERVKAASNARVFEHRPLPERRCTLTSPTRDIIAIGASTGGTEAIRRVLAELPENSPGTLIVQHMPAHFTRPFADRLDSECALHVKEAEDGEPVERGKVLIAPGGHHLELARSEDDYIASVWAGPKFNGHCPSVDVLFRSTAKHAGPRAVGVLMTGMGVDGATELGSMRRAGAVTIAQNSESSVVYGMPKAAVERGAAQHVVSLDEIAGCITESVESEEATSEAEDASAPQSQGDATPSQQA